MSKWVLGSELDSTSATRLLELLVIRGVAISERYSGSRHLLTDTRQELSITSRWRGYWRGCLSASGPTPRAFGNHPVINKLRELRHKNRTAIWSISIFCRKDNAREYSRRDTVYQCFYMCLLWFLYAFCVILMYFSLVLAYFPSARDRRKVYV